MMTMMKTVHLKIEVLQICSAAHGLKSIQIWKLGRTYPGQTQRIRYGTDSRPCHFKMPRITWIPEPPSKIAFPSQRNTPSAGRSTTCSPDTPHRSAFVFPSLAISGLQTERNPMDTLLDETEESMRALRLLPTRRSIERRFSRN